ncbi:ABC transporter ATP-binding protein [Fictibacillus macauensis ZFHKF-1]|uniref:ABC transporter ATP-binding protein n=1 Tax=Fictibacillus macauensis ZFHKF-1 TaxID=1196324 RepID=I8UFW0_9BACL|nr:ATP-binding cassette domain-containing protein [Fictibacillus macauensis]EIT85713.1 ABC transporter ATP-binding protein [Fictibacillus macauensis ZFHKF-1]
MTLELQHIHKSFGSTKAVSNVSFTLAEGEVLGLLGRNGAGKTTTIKIILGLLRHEQGEIRWKGASFHRDHLSIGYLPEERGLYQKSTVVDQLSYFAQLEGMSKKRSLQAIDHWLEKLEITEHRNKKAGDLSKGNQQKIQLIATLMHDPELLILDEPFSGLDPINANLLSSIIEELVKQKKTVILSSHRMDQIEPFCENVCLLKNGAVVSAGRLREIKENYGYRNVSIPHEAAVERVLMNAALPYEQKVNELVVRVKNDEEAFAIFEKLKAAEVHVRSFKLLEPTLHEIFLEKVK